jgi:ATP-dependent DNA helicase DinG
MSDVLTEISSPAGTAALPDIPSVVAGAGRIYVLTTDGEVKDLAPEQASAFLKDQASLVCHGPFTRARTGIENLPAFDLLELFAFVHPGKFCAPTPRGLGRALGVEQPADNEDLPLMLYDCARGLLSDLRNQKNPEKILAIAEIMGLQGKGWPWTPFIFEALGREYDPKKALFGKNALNVWRDLPEWSEEAPVPPPAHHPVTGEEARARLEQLLGNNSEIRPQQLEYAATVAGAFRPVEPLDTEENEPHLILAEAGTGVGKTLGYLAPANVWTEKNGGNVWISTYTKNLQRQIEDELDRLYPDRQLKENRVAVRKGRENYLCLLNFEEMASGAGLARYPAHAVGAGLMARWISVTKDGDLGGGDFPGWLPGLVGRGYSSALSDRRGECIYGACDHYHRCFVERSVRKARHASLVVANHALVMVLAAQSEADGAMPLRYIFDEGHHLFEAADSAYAGHLTARETRDLRRWLLGAEAGKRSRARGLYKRVEDLIVGDSNAEGALHAIQTAARDLTGNGWNKRLDSGMPSGPAEKFLHAVYAQVYARAKGIDGPYSLETGTYPLADGVPETARALKASLKRLHNPLKNLSKRLREKLAEDQGEMSADMRRRHDSVASSIDIRVKNVKAWLEMLESLEAGGGEEEFVDWMEIARIDGQPVDVGLYRHYVDPMRPFAASIRPHAHGIAVTSATMRDGTGDDEADWKAARERTGADYLTHSPVQMDVDSPFDYAANSRVLIINDVNKNDMDQVASAYRALFEAADGGALGLFTAIQRLRAVHEIIAGPMERGGYSIYAQHADQINTGTLVDIFREDTHACLLGTDAVRDGIDVPGESLRLLVYDRVPWPRPTILHKARRERFGGRRYDEMLTRLRLRQAFGRLIRSTSDRGVFVMLDSLLPSRLLGAFPEGANVQRAGLAEAVLEVKSFL